MEDSKGLMSWMKGSIGVWKRSARWFIAIPRSFRIISAMAAGGHDMTPKEMEWLFIITYIIALPSIIGIIFILTLQVVLSPLTWVVHRVHNRSK